MTNEGLKDALSVLRYSNLFSLGSMGLSFFRSYIRRKKERTNHSTAFTFLDFPFFHFRRFWKLNYFWGEMGPHKN